MHALVRLLVVVLLLGTAARQGWLQAAIGFVTEHLGGPVVTLGPLPQVDLPALAHQLGEAVAGLPDPWYSLALMVGGIIALVFLASVVSGLVRATLRLTTWLRDAFV